jgi:hypothetical protein
MILEGFRRERSKPTTPPPFPGASAAPGFRSPSAVPFPAGTAESGRLRWQSPAPLVTVSWHRGLDNSTRGMQQRAAAAEVHLAFSGDVARLQVGELGDLKDLLPDHGRRTGIFTRLEALESHALDLPHSSLVGRRSALTRRP